VYAPGKPYCGECAYCQSNHQHLCENVTSLGYDRPGALAEYVCVPVKSLCRLPEGVTDAEGAAMQPMASSVLCTIDAGIEPGDDVAVIGTGVMGLQCALLAKRFGAGRVFVVDVRERPLEIAVKNGLIPINAKSTTIVEAIREATDNIGADVVFEAVGADHSNGTKGNDPLAQSIDAARRGGTVLQVSHIEGEIQMKPRYLRGKSVSWINPRKGVISLSPGTDTGDFAARLVAGDEIPIEEYVTHELDGLTEFEQAVNITLEKDKYGALGPAQLVLG